VPVHVSIHDVSPAFADDVEAALVLCHAAGARPALLVVPDFHGRAPLLANARFCERLRALQASGHEVYLHGLRHRSEPRHHASSGQGRARWLFAQRVLSGGEAEMSDVDRDEGVARIERGEAVLREAGLRVDGYVAPAWSMPAWLLPVLAARGYAFTEDHLRAYDPAAGASRATVLLNWASRSPARMLSTIAWCRAVRPARRVLPARIAIHPGDMRVLALRREIAGTLRWAAGDFVARGHDLLSA
jgi:hypothetical protein